MFNITSTFLLLSGIASLTYQVVWVRLLGISLGSTSASISTVLAAFFLGLSIGSYLTERISRNHNESIRTYIILEAIIGISGLILLPVLLNIDTYIAATSTLTSTTAIKFIITIVLLITPTICMGATFPVMANILIRNNSELGVKVSQLYSLNTAGAVLGAALSGFVFIPNWGLDGAVYIAASINFLIVTIGFYIDRNMKLPAMEIAELVEITDNPVTQETYNLQAFQKQALVVLFATGLVAIATEVGWTKYLSIFTGTTIYGFSAILTIFLLGISAGSWVIKSYMDRIYRPTLWMTVGLILLGGVLLLTRSSFIWIPPIYNSINHIKTTSEIMQTMKYIIVFILLFPATFLFGALFPLNLKIYCGNLHGIHTRLGKAYAVNTMASIIGALIAGFWIIPYFGTDTLLTVMAFILLLVALIFIPTINNRLKTIMTSVLILTIASNWLLPHIRYDELITSVQFDNHAFNGKKPKYLFLKEGKAGIISMVTFDDHYAILQNNGLNESVLDLKNRNSVLLVESLLGVIPYMLHNNPQSAFVVGFGGGITTKALTKTSVKSIRVVELEPAVVDAGRAIIKGEIPALQDPRVQLNFNDARNTLLIEKKKYDIIASQPSHPWLARAANVFSRDFFKLVKSKLNQGGIFSQWVSLFQMDSTTLKSILKAFYQTFPHGMTFANLATGDFIMIGSDSPLTLDFDKINKHLNEPKIHALLSYNGINNADDLMLYFALSRQEALTAAGDVPANTDLNILSEVRLSKNTHVLAGDENPYKFLRAHYTLNIKPYLGKQYKQRISELARYYVNKKNAVLVEQQAAKQVARFDPTLARGLEYDTLWKQEKYQSAQKLYKSYKKWPARIHLKHILSLKKQDLNNKTSLILDPVKARKIRRAIKENKNIESLWQTIRLSQE